MEDFFPSFLPKQIMWVGQKWQISEKNNPASRTWLFLPWIQWWEMSRSMTKPTKLSVRPAKTQIILGIPKSDKSLRYPHKETLGP